MTSIRLKYVQAFEDRHGRQRFYFRRKGVKPIPLPGLPGSKEFLGAYQAALTSTAVEDKIGALVPGSFNALIATYYTTDGFKSLKEITQKGYRAWLERFRRERGGLMVRTFERQHAAILLDALSGKPGAQKSMRRMLNILLGLAVERNWRKDNPMLGIRRKTTKSASGWRSWSEEDIQRFEAKYPSGSRERLALALLLYTAQRRKDVVTFGRQHHKGGMIVLVTSKSNETTKLEIPVHANLQAEINQVPKDQLTFLQTQYGAPFTAAGFGNWMRDVVRAAGIVEQASPHGLRKASCRRLAEAGATPHQIMAITGHKNLSEVTLYTEAANQKHMAQAGMDKIGTGTMGVKPGSPV